MLLLFKHFLYGALQIFYYLSIYYEKCNLIHEKPDLQIEKVELQFYSSLVSKLLCDWLCLDHLEL